MLQATQQQQCHQRAQHRLVHDLDVPRGMTFVFPQHAVLLMCLQQQQQQPSSVACVCLWQCFYLHSCAHCLGLCNGCAGTSTLPLLFACSLVVTLLVTPAVTAYLNSKGHAQGRSVAVCSSSNSSRGDCSSSVLQYCCAWPFAPACQQAHDTTTAQQQQQQQQHTPFPAGRRAGMPTVPHLCCGHFKCRCHD